MATANKHHAGRVMVVVGHTSKSTKPNVNQRHGRTLQYAILKCPHCGATTERMSSRLSTHKCVCFGTKTQTLIPRNAATHYERETLRGAEANPLQARIVDVGRRLENATRNVEVLREELKAAEARVETLTRERDMLLVQAGKAAGGEPSGDAALMYDADVRPTGYFAKRGEEGSGNVG